MSLRNVLEYVETRPFEDGSETLGELYGTENFCVFLYSMLRMEKPEVVVELGMGAGVTTCAIGDALRENGRGHLWVVDDGSDWRQKDDLRLAFQRAVGGVVDGETFASFVERLTSKFGCLSQVTYVDLHFDLDGKVFFAPPEAKIDVVFADAPPSDAEGCVGLLWY